LHTDLIRILPIPRSAGFSGCNVGGSALGSMFVVALTGTESDGVSEGADGWAVESEPDAGAAL
jgi:hypothetical protein